MTSEAPAERRPPPHLATVLLAAMDAARRARPRSWDQAARIVSAEASSRGVVIDDDQAAHLARVATSWSWRARHPRRWARYRFRRTLTIIG